MGRTNANVGELLPYILTDSGRSNNVTYESFSSIPVHAQDHTLKVLIFQSGQGNFGSSYTFSFGASHDGYDLIDATFSSYTSIIRTSDRGCFDQRLTHDGSISPIPDRAGRLIPFPYASDPLAFPQSSSTDVHTYKVQITHNLPDCANGDSNGVSYWNSPASYTFETERTLQAIKQDHFAAINLSS